MTAVCPDDGDEHDVAACALEGATGCSCCAAAWLTWRIEPHRGQR